MNHRFTTYSLLVIATLLLVSMAFAGAASADNASGAGNDHITEINTVDDLIKFANAVNNGDEYIDETVNLATDLNLSDIPNWTPIGTTKHPFSGSFNGNGHTIRNLKITSDNDCVGLFGYVLWHDDSDQSITSLTLENCDIKGGDRVGGIVGRCYFIGSKWYIINNKIADCRVSGTICGNNEVGGIAGNCYYESITNCQVSGTISGNENIGGITGYTERTDITDCHVSGTISGYEDIGGIAGDFREGTLTYSSVSGTVVGTGECVGGIIGYSKQPNLNPDENLEYCYSTANVTGYYKVGGICGYLHVCNKIIDENPGIYNCYSTGDITATSGRCGGIVGEVNCKIVFSISSADGPNDESNGEYPNYAVRYCYATGSVVTYPGEGDANTGGIVGYAHASNAITGITIRDCVALNKKVSSVNGIAGTITSVNKKYVDWRYNYAWDNLPLEYKEEGVNEQYSVSQSSVWDTDVSADNTPWKGASFDSDVWTKNYDDNYKFQLPVLITLGNDAISDASHLDPNPHQMVTVSFAMQEHGEAVPSQTITKGNPAVKPTDPTAAGWKFNGWFMEPECKNEWLFDRPVVKDMTLYASWSNVDTYTVTFNTLGHGTPVTTQHVAAGEKAIEPTNVTDPAYNLAGWYTDTSFATRYTFTTPVTKDLILYAKWELKPLTILFDVQGKGSAPEPQFLNTGEKIIKPADPVDEGYVFKGWFKESGCITEWDFNTSTVEDNTTLYAKWNPICRVSFDVQGLGKEPSSQNIESGNTAKKPADPVAEGYRFDGWYEKASCIDSPYDFNTSVTKSFTLFAKWTPVYEVTFDLQGLGEKIEPQQIGYDGYVTKPDNPVATGFEFGGWYTNAACTGSPYDFTAKVDKSFTLYAHWPCTIEFNTTGGSHVESQSLKYGDTVTRPAVPTKEGEMFTGWFKESTCTTQWNFIHDTVSQKNTTLFAGWDNRSYTHHITVTCPKNASLSLSNESAPKGEIITFEIAAYNGYTLSDITVKTYEPATVPVNLTKRSNTTWYGNFTMPNVNVMFNVSVTAPVYYNVTVNTSVTNGTITSDQQKAYAGENVQATLTPIDGCYLIDDKLKVTSRNESGAEHTRYVSAYLDPSKMKYTARFIMPTSDVSLDATFWNYTNISITPPAHGTITASKYSAKCGDTITLYIQPDNGYDISSLTMYGDEFVDELKRAGTGYTFEFTAPSYDVTVGSVFSTVRQITLTSTGSGTIYADRTSAVVNTSVEIYLVPGDGYTVGAVNYTCGGTTTDISVNQSSHHLFTGMFVMPAGDGEVTVSAEFKEKYPDMIIITDRNVDFGTYVETPTTDSSAYSLNTSVGNSYDGLMVYLVFPDETTRNFVYNVTVNNVETNRTIVPIDVNKLANITISPRSLDIGGYADKIRVYVGTDNEDQVSLYDTIRVTLDILDANKSEEAYIPKLPLKSDSSISSNTSIGKYAAVNNASYLNVSGSTAVISNISESNPTKLIITNVSPIESTKGKAVELHDTSIITAVYPEIENTKNGFNYTINISLTEVAEPPALSGEHNESVAHAVQNTGNTPKYMVTALTDKNDIIEHNGIELTFLIPQSSISDSGKLCAYHVSDSLIATPIPIEVMSEGNRYMITINGSTFSSYVIAESNSQSPSSGGSSHQSGYTQILPEEPTLTPTQSPIANPTTKPTTQATSQPTQSSPAPVVGILIGLGTAAIILRLRK